MNQWYTTKIRMICLVEGIGGLRYNDSLFLISADSFESAFEKSLQIGESQEEEYYNEDAQKVRWCCKEILSLDILKNGLRDGIELYSEPVKMPESERFQFDQKFFPALSQPTQTH